MKNCILFTALFILFITQLYAQDVANLEGTVINNLNNGIAGATVHILNTNLQTFTDANGRYLFAGIQPGRYTIEASAIGYAVSTITIATNNNNDATVIKLQPDVKQLDEVVVTAQKTEETRQQLPVSITALSAKKVEEYRIWNTKDITGIVPNVYAADPGDKRNITAVRGIATTSYDQAVATYIDGVNQFGLDTYISPLFDIERIEVLRGPQGTLYGRNAMGGVVNIVTKQPTNQLSGFAEASIGNYGLQRYTAGIKAPLIKDKLYIGVAGLYEGMNGFYTNDFNNRHYDKQHSIGGNYYLKYVANKQWSFSLNAKQNNNRNHGPFPLVADRNEAFSNAYHVNQNATTLLIDNIFNTSLSANYSGTHFNFTSQTAYQYNYRIYDQPIDADFSPLDAMSLINNYGKHWNTVKVWTQEFRFSSPASAVSPFKWVAGTFLFTQNSPVKQATHFGKDAALLGSQDSNFTLLNTTTAKKYGAAVFGQITYAVSSKLNIAGGLRYDYEHQQQHILGEYFVDGVPDAVFAFQPDTSAAAHFNAWSPKLSADYKINKNSLLFATYSKGYRAGGLTPISSDHSQPALYAFKPEYSNNFEAGIKNSLYNNRLLLNITAFYTKITDAQVPTLVLPDAVTITKNTGKLTSKGVEVELNTIIAKGLTADYSSGYTHALYDNLKVSSNGSELNLKGKRQVFTPNTTSMLALQYRFAAGSNSKTFFAIRGEWKWIGKQYFDLANTISQNQYSLFNVQATASFNKLSVKFWSRNMAGKKYIAYAYDFGAIHLGDPATYGATVQFKF